MTGFEGINLIAGMVFATASLFFGVHGKKGQTCVTLAGVATLLALGSLVIRSTGAA